MRWLGIFIITSTFIFLTILIDVFYLKPKEKFEKLEQHKKECQEIAKKERKELDNNIELKKIPLKFQELLIREVQVNYINCLKSFE